MRIKRWHSAIRGIGNAGRMFPVVSGMQGTVIPIVWGLCVITRNNKRTNSGTEHHNTMRNSKPGLPRLLTGPEPLDMIQATTQQTVTHSPILGRFEKGEPPNPFQDCQFAISSQQPEHSHMFGRRKLNLDRRRQTTSMSRHMSNSMVLQPFGVWYSSGPKTPSLVV